MLETLLTYTCVTVQIIKLGKEHLKWTILSCRILLLQLLSGISPFTLPSNFFSISKGANVGIRIKPVFLLNYHLPFQDSLILLGTHSSSWDPVDDGRAQVHVSFTCPEKEIIGGKKLLVMGLPKNCSKQLYSPQILLKVAVLFDS